MKYYILIILILLLSACAQIQSSDDRVIRTPGLRDAQPLPQQQTIQENASPKIPQGTPQQLETKQLTISTKNDQLTYTVQVADEDHEQRIGLMHVTQMPQDKGMIFLFDFESRQGFWMKNTLIPLDIIFIDKDWKILNIAQAQPCKADPCPSYYSNGLSTYVLELNAGQSIKNNIQPGDSIGLVN